MTKKIQELIDIEMAFYDVEKPDNFTNYMHCEECAEHNELLKTRNRHTLQIEDVGNIGWQPISFCSPEGIAYYMPALARLALIEIDTYGWYGDTLYLHLSHNGSENAFLKYCSVGQRQAVAKFLRYLNKAFIDSYMRTTEFEEIEKCAAIWDNSIS